MPLKGNGEDRTIEVLLAIQGELVRLGDRFDGLRGEFAELRTEFVTFRRQINERLDRIIENTGEHWRDLERRVRVLEDKVPRT